MIARLLFAFIVISLWCSDMIQGMGTYKYIMQSMAGCSGPEYADSESPLKNVVFKKINRTTQTISFDLEWKRPIDNTLGATLKAEKLSNGGGGHMAVPFIPLMVDPCNILLKNFRNHWVDFTTNMGVPEPEKCPIPPGNYSLKNLVFNTEYSQQNSFPIVGRFLYRTTIIDLKTKKIITCVETITEHAKL
ncbi:uncharacterized protein LOC114329764 [Diabrotica virgifera virgifera]|uniref:Uncharacterized protein LOC114329764 n=1 Tax=Diabrotica virgifera virgifera TaxID=50390 RepID=A0A6P7FP97_DIAVI|nr:uncharacterized protein LOC114329764 [Diabrotica virgifera virgifera]